jgi:hypothetical protein
MTFYVFALDDAKLIWSGLDLDPSPNGKITELQLKQQMERLEPGKYGIVKSKNLLFADVERNVKVYFREN